MTSHIFFLRKSVNTLFWDSATLSCSARLEFFIVNLARLVASDVTALARLFRELYVCDSSTWV